MSRRYPRNIKTDDNIKKILDGGKKNRGKKRSRTKYVDVDHKKSYPTKDWQRRYSQALYGGKPRRGR